MRYAVLVGLVCLGLIACGGATPTPTVAVAPTQVPGGSAPPAGRGTYQGVRWRDFPTPGEIEIQSQEDKRLFLYVRGSQQAVVDQYVATAEGDGYRRLPNAGKSDQVVYTYEKGNRLYILVFSEQLRDGRVIVGIAEQ